VDDTLIHINEAFNQEVTNISGIDIDRPKMILGPDGTISGPIPQFKYALLLDYGRRYGSKTFIETGTCYGNACEVARHVFDTVYSIELSQEYHDYAKSRFQSFSNVRLFLGDSGQLLRKLLLEIPDTPALFWLDAHWSGGDTARGQTDPPTELELDVIHELRPNSVILIDDMWELTSDWIARYGRGKHVSNKYGITRIVP
jgi:hypothetical protein